MGAGWYRDAYYPPELLVDRRSVDSLAEELVAEVTTGVGDTGVRPGILGEIGTDKPWVTPAEERVHRAVARASRRTGLAITTHAVLSDVGAAQLTIFEEEGVDPGRVVIGHADSYPHLDHYLSLISRGASIEFDFLGMSFTPTEVHGEGRIIDLLLELLHRGHGDRILLSQDVCHNSQLRRYGGNGYTYLQETFLPRLRERGVSEAEIDQLTIAQPAPRPDDRLGSPRASRRVAAARAGCTVGAPRSGTCRRPTRRHRDRASRGRADHAHGASGHARRIGRRPHAQRVPHAAHGDRAAGGGSESRRGARAEPHNGRAAARNDRTGRDDPAGRWTRR